jgi:hypothetical protein
MTTVHPIFVVETSDKKNTSGQCSIRSRQNSSSRISTINSKLLSHSLARFDDNDEDDIKFPDETFAAHDVLFQSLASLLNRMKFFGLYFTVDKYCSLRRLNDKTISSNPERIVRHQQASENIPKIDCKRYDEKAHNINKAYKIYAMAVLAMLWFNALRMLTAFNGSDKFNDVLFAKLVNLLWTLMCAINQTSTFVACQSGRLHRILRDIRVTQEFANKIRRKAIIDAILGASVYVFNGTFFSYYFFFTTGTYYDFFLAPFATMFPVNDTVTLYVLRGTFCVVAVFMLSGWLLPMALNSTLAGIFYGQFMILNTRLEKSIDETGRFNGSIRILRRRHQLISRAVKRADHFVRISNLAGFGCHMACFLIILYTLLFFSVSSTTAMIGILIFWLTNGVGLTLTTINGIIVNVSVSIKMSYKNQYFNVEA